MATVIDRPEPTDPPPAPDKRRRRIRIAVVAAVVLVPVIAWLAFGYFGVQFLFIDDEVDEANPFATEAVAAEGAEPDATEAAAAPDVITLASGGFEGRAHPTSGTANVITDGSGARFLRLEDFATDNGPDLNVYLVAGGDIDNGFVDLGDLKGNIGDQNYELDPSVDLDVYDTVVIWCVRFSVNFGEAALTA